ncbi:MAG: hypothetical protein ACM3Y9_08845 [Ignavibacteria bacterium]
MDGAGISVGGIASVGVAAGINIAASPTMAGQPAGSITVGVAASASAADFVVSISDAAMQAFTLDATAAAGNASPSQLADDLAALALLAILERDQRQQDAALVTAAAAIGAYLAMQAMTPNG